MRSERLISKASEHIVGASELGWISKSLDIIGDIAVLKISPELLDRRFQLGEALIQKSRSIRVVVRQTTPTRSGTRTRGIEWLAGEKRTVSIHKEHGSSLKVDVSKVFFSPRLSYERMRIARLVASTPKPETIVNFYAGVGSFSILIAKHAAVQKIYSIDASPNAVAYHIANLCLNCLRGKVVVLLGRAEDMVPSLLTGRADRVIMPLPELALEHLSFAVSALTPDGGTIHFYGFQRGESEQEAITRTIERVSKQLAGLHTSFHVEHSRVIRTVGSRQYQIVLDLNVKSKAH